jgi:hypothetical protein
VPASNTARFLIFSGVIVVFATTVIIATKGRVGRAKEAVETPTVVSDQDLYPENLVPIPSELALMAYASGQVE